MEKTIIIPVLLWALLTATMAPDRAGAASITTIKEPFVKSMDWHPGLNRIAFGKLDLTDGYYDVFVMNPDGGGEECLTCDLEGTPQKHNGNPAWHPSGEYLVFTAQNPVFPDEIDDYAIPGSGLGCDLRLLDPARGRSYALTDYSDKYPLRAVIHPQFSHHGTRLFWAERVRDGDSFHGGWVLKLADFIDDPAGPALANIQTLTPGRRPTRFVESHAFSPDDTKLLFCGNLEPGQIAYGMDIYELDLATGDLTRLTRTDNDWDEHAHYSLDGSRIAWMSSTGFDLDWGAVAGDDHFDLLSTELWLMAADGSSPRQLTYFNQPGHPHHICPKTIVSDSAWGPEGDRLAVLIAYRTAFGLNSKIVILDLP